MLKKICFVSMYFFWIVASEKSINIHVDTLYDAAPTQKQTVSLQGHISIQTFLDGMTISETVRQNVATLLFDLKDYDVQDIEQTEYCLETGETFIKNVLLNLPVDGVLLHIAKTAFYMGEGCTRKAFEIAYQIMRQNTSLNKIQNCHNDEKEHCFNKYETQLLNLMQQSKSVGLMYSVFAAAVYGAEHHSHAARSSVEMVIHDALGVNLTNLFSDTSRNSRIKRGACNNNGEKKAQQVISWIPIIGTIYNLASAATYAGLGCTNIAKERAIDGTIDIAMDIGTAVTFGAGAAAFQGIKIASKVGIKAGTKALMKVGQKAIKSQVKSVVKLYKNPLKGAFRETVDTVKSVYQVGKLLNKGGRRVVKKFGKKANKIDDIARTSGKIVDTGPTKSLKRCRRMDGGLCNIGKLQSANDRSIKRASDYQNQFENLKNLPSDTRQATLDKLTTKEWSRIMQQQTPDTKFEYSRIIGGQMMEIKTRPQPFIHSRKQFFFTINNQRPSYKDILTKLDKGMTKQNRKDLAAAMLDEMDRSATNSMDFGKIVVKEKAEKASELIVLTQIAESVPARTPGSDKDFRGLLRSIRDSDGEQTFYKTVMSGYPPAAQDGTGLQRILADSGTSNYNNENLKRKLISSKNKNSRKRIDTHTDIDTVDNIKERYSDSSSRRRRSA